MKLPQSHRIDRTISPFLFICQMIEFILDCDPRSIYMMMGNGSHGALDLDHHHQINIYIHILANAHSYIRQSNKNRWEMVCGEFNQRHFTRMTCCSITINDCFWEENNATYTKKCRQSQLLPHVMLIIRSSVECCLWILQMLHHTHTHIYIWGKKCWINQLAIYLWFKFRSTWSLKYVCGLWFKIRFLNIYGFVENVNFTCIMYDDVMNAKDMLIEVFKHYFSFIPIWINLTRLEEM